MISFAGPVYPETKKDRITEISFLKWEKYVFLAFQKRWKFVFTT